MSSHVSAGLRRDVPMRADGTCEYRLIHKRDTFLGCQVDLVISEKHGVATHGPTVTSTVVASEAGLPVETNDQDNEAAILTPATFPPEQEI